ncbi:MAG: 3-oxoacid CoA-transferase subunit B [Acidaminococcales bacterium]|nr:3-oxoacid CoA-transferase subunit B [Acidaminococcales bacterium]
MTEREIIAKRVAEELPDGGVVNLGIGIPGLAADFIPEGINIILHSENGLIGIAGVQGANDPEIKNAGGQMVVPAPDAVTLDSSLSFALARGGHIDVSVLGALQVDKEGNLANYTAPGKFAPGMGGAMDIVAGAKRVIAAMSHCTRDGCYKILDKCTMPLTAVRAVDMIITELAVFEVTGEGLLLTEYAPGTSLAEIREKTGTDFAVSEYVKERRL